MSSSDSTYFNEIFLLLYYSLHLLRPIMKSNWSIQPIKNGSGMMLIVVYSKKDVRTCAATRISSDLESPDLSVSGTPGSTSEAENDLQDQPPSSRLGMWTAIKGNRGLLPHQNCPGRAR